MTEATMYEWVDIKTTGEANNDAHRAEIVLREMCKGGDGPAAGDLRRAIHLLRQARREISAALAKVYDERDPTGASGRHLRGR